MRNLIIVKLQGGLGNQLFQYAAGRRLAIRHDTPLKLDLNWFSQYQLRSYALNLFPIQESIATREEVAELKGTARTGVMRKLFRLRQKYRPYYRRVIFAESYRKPFDSNIWKTPRDVYLEGYWQDERYFVDINDIIKQEFTMKSTPEVRTRALAQQISSSQSVSLHVRRGDGVSGPQDYGLCGLDYYRKCVDFIVKKVTKPQFFVFSDDPEWTYEHIKLDYSAVYVTHNLQRRDHEDLWLMSLCKHNIIANSTFSWWGAWLNPNPDKIVLAPARWFKELNNDARGLVPDAWTKI